MEKLGETIREFLKNKMSVKMFYFIIKGLFTKLKNHKNYII